MSDVSVSDIKRIDEDTATASFKITLNKLLVEGARAWNISQTGLILICLIPVFVALFGIGTALVGKEAYKWFTAEDRFGENLQIVFWILTFILCLRIISHKLRADDKTIATLYTILGIGIFFLIGEELSWGQRIFGWITPESMRIINKQGETNIHTIYGVDTMFKWVHFVIGAYGTFLPLLVMRSEKLQRYRTQLSLLVPHYTLIPFFVIPFIWRIYRNFFDEPSQYYFVIAEYAEVMELILSIGFFFFMIFQLRQIKMQRNLSKHS